MDFLLWFAPFGPACKVGLNIIGDGSGIPDVP